MHNGESQILENILSDVSSHISGLTFNLRISLGVGQAVKGVGQAVLWDSFTFTKDGEGIEYITINQDKATMNHQGSISNSHSDERQTPPPPLSLL